MEILHYVAPNGQDLYQNWLNQLRDRMAQARITMRINRLSAGHFGDCRPVGEGVWELKINYGAGYRVYYAQAGQAVVLLLLGGDKRTQQADIHQAHACWKAYQEQRP